MATTEIEKYVEAAKAASDRSRSVLLVLIVGSILTFAAFWNSRQAGWLTQRLRLARIGLQLCHQAPAGSQVGYQQGEGLPPGPDFSITNPLYQWLPPADKDLVPRASQYYEERHFLCCENLRAEVQELEKINTGAIEFIHVPFLGFSFDVNDLGMLAGIAFVVGLVWLRLSLQGEFRSVKETFAQAQRLTNGYSELAFAYQLLGMYQVFTRLPGEAEPKVSRKKLVFQWIAFGLAWIILVLFVLMDLRDAFQPGRSRWSLAKILVDLLVTYIAGTFLVKAQPTKLDKFWQRLSSGLYSLPLIIILAVIRNDFGSMNLGRSVSSSATLSVLMVEALLLLVTWSLVDDCSKIAEKTDQEWIKVEKRLSTVLPSASSPGGAT